jgi:hypothetical protein
MTRELRITKKRWHKDSLEGRFGKSSTLIHELASGNSNSGLASGNSNSGSSSSSRGGSSSSGSSSLIKRVNENSVVVVVLV